MVVIYSMAYCCRYCRSKSRINNSWPKRKIRANQDDIEAASGRSFNRRNFLEKWLNLLLDVRPGTISE